MPHLSHFAKAFALFSLLFAQMAAAHEFWIEPRKYEVQVGDTIEADIRNGQFFKGSTYPYLTSFFSEFAVIDSAGARPVEGRLGDNPAVQLKALRGGLHIFAYISTVSVVNYPNFEKFKGFVEDKKMPYIVDRHRARGLPEDKVRETYYRYVKSLVKVGSGAGRDRALGMPIELVAEINPYSAAAADGVRMLLLWNGKPLPNWDIQVFHYAPDATEATKTHFTTDATGRAMIPRMGGGEFLINAVQITEPRAEDADKNSVWESIWASMTYELR